MINLEDRIDNFRNIMKDAVGQNGPLENYLIENGFFTAPASAGHHGAVEGGLFDHSYAVTEALLDLTKSMNLSWNEPTSPYVIGMFHDLCKIDSYVKVPEVYTNGELTKYHFEYNKDCLVPGHGEKSVLLLQKFVNLTEEEILCIRWHMGAFDNKENWKYYSAAVRKYPNVLYTHTADMIASQVLGV